MGYALAGTPLDIWQKARILWQSLSLLSQCSEHVTIPHNFSICVRALCARARVVSRVNGTDIRTLRSPHPLIVDCLLAPGADPGLTGGGGAKYTEREFLSDAHFCHLVWVGGA